VICALIALVIVCTAVPAAAQGSGSAGGPSHPMIFGLGLGDTGEAEGRVYDIRMPFGYTLIKPEDRPWGLRLRLIVYAGIYDFEIRDAVDLDLKFQSLAATPGVEFLVPVGKGWTLKPFTEIGYARDFENKLDFGVWSVGMRTLTEWQARSLDMSFGTKVQYLSSFRSDLVLADDYLEVELGLDVGIPLGFRIGGHESYLSPYVIHRRYVDAFIARPEGESLELQYHSQVGLAFGTHPRIKLWFITLPRIGVGYRWGPSVEGWRLSFGFPF
jgi:hypothetical protein